MTRDYIASEVRPGPRPPTLCPRDVTVGEAGPEALSTVSLPNMPWRGLQRWMWRLRTDHPVLGALRNIDADDRPLA
jgi:hypothetical protein